MNASCRLFGIVLLNRAIKDCISVARLVMEPLGQMTSSGLETTHSVELDARSGDTPDF